MAAAEAAASGDVAWWPPEEPAPKRSEPQVYEMWLEMGHHELHDRWCMLWVVDSSGSQASGCL